MFESIDARIHTLWRVSLQAEGRATRRKAEMLAMLEAIKDRQSELAIQLTREHVLAAREAALMVIDGKH
jgi:DNA-binding GntR family transcriptional regulator